MRLTERVRNKLETARALASHTIVDGSWEDVLEAALDCYIERLEKRRAAKAAHPRATASASVADADAKRPGLSDASAPAGHAGERVHAADRVRAADRGSIPAAVRRVVWARDGGCCSFVGLDGTRCGSRIRVEVDHIVPFARGGPSTVENLRLLCRRHNVREAQNLFGERFMRQFVGG